LLDVRSRKFSTIDKKNNLNATLVSLVIATTMPPEKNAPKKWKPPKGPKPVHHKNKNIVGLGKTIASVRAKENQVQYLPDGDIRFTTDKREADWVKLRSVTHENALEDFLNTAELADTDFTAEKRSTVKIIKVDNRQNPYLLSKEEERKKHDLQKEHEVDLIIPRRPAWDTSMTKFQLERQEKEAFLKWRRQLAALQENKDLLLTPFERNLEVWKQLWRVIERSDLVVQIVDARNPLLFRSKDLEKSVKELDPRKENLLLVNKADLLTKAQRVKWAEYFIKNNIRYTFFSAAKANELLLAEANEENAEEDSSSDHDSEDEFEDTDEESIADSEEETDKENSLPSSSHVDSNEHENETTDDGEDEDEHTRIITINELEDLLLRAAPGPLTEPLEGQTQRLQIGLVGYPNVGKSSTINALVGSKKVSVSSTPGKTKHFQTILLSDSVILCDCPGLVFPNFAYTNGELVCNGVLPIDQLREHTGPVELVCQRIPKFFLEAVYGIAIPTKPVEEGGLGYPSPQELLNAYARARGYMTQGFGAADESRASRYILKDYVSGKLLYVRPPPNDDNTPITIEQGKDFNKELYTVDHLPESRRQQLLQAAKEKHIDILDLQSDLSKLTFSGHVGSSSSKGAAYTGTNYGGKQAALFSASEELDKEFFKMSSGKGIVSNPFHKLGAPSAGKKHNKKNKKKNVKNTEMY